MFDTLKMDRFAEQLKAIRIRRKLTQAMVAEQTGINADTLRRLEKGEHIPRIETLTVLSKYYKEDLHTLLQQCMVSNRIWSLYNQIDRLITRDEPEKILEHIRAFKDEISEYAEGLVEASDLEQIRLFLCGLECSYTGDISDSIRLYVDALKVFNPEYSLERWDETSYNAFELRILFSLSSELGAMKEIERSNEMLKFLLQRLDDTLHSGYFQKLLMTKIYASLAYNFHRLSDDKQAVYYADQGIKYCIDSELTSFLPLLLLRKGTGLIHLGNMEGELYLDQAIQLLNILGNFSLMEKYITVKEKLLNAR